VSTGKVRPRLVVVWALFAVLVGAIVVVETTDILEPAPPAPTGSLPMFEFTEADLGAVEVIYRGRLGTLMRDAEGQWFRHDASHSHSDGAAADAAPEETETHRSDPKAAAEVADQLAVTARMLADRRVPLEQGPAAYGLANPEVMIAFYRRGADGADYSRPLEVLYVGDLLAAGYTYYTRREHDRELSLIPRYQVALLLAQIFGADQAPTPMPEWSATTDP